MTNSVSVSDGKVQITTLILSDEEPFLSQLNLCRGTPSFSTISQLSVIDQRLVDNSPFSRDIFFPLSFFLFFPFERKTDEESSAWGKVGHLGSFQAFKETSWKSVTHQQPELKTEATSPQIS